MASIIVSGFAPFDGCPHNPSQELAQHVHGKEIAGVSIVGVVLPVVRYRSWDRLKDHISKHNPKAVIALGQSNRAEINLERWAYNIDHYRIADNEGNQPQDEVVVQTAPSRYPSTLPVERIEQSLRHAGCSTVFSDDAGRFVCNHLFFQMQHALRETQIRSGFIHVPFRYQSWVEEGIEQVIDVVSASLHGAT